MATLKVIEILSQSDQGWEDAAQKAVDQASKTVSGIRSIYIENMEASVSDGKITQYRINGKLSFELQDS